MVKADTIMRGNKKKTGGYALKALSPVLTASLLFLFGLAVVNGRAFAEDAKPSENKDASKAGALKQPELIEPPYKPVEAFKSFINPHEQISDEGELLVEKCTICHLNVPDQKTERSIKDVKLRFGDDLNDICNRCHKQRKHPGTEDISSTMSGMPAPDHLVVPSSNIKKNARLVMKEIPTILPFEPKTGRVICVTCHNPHERGVLYGKADWGSDTRYRLRTESTDICQFCHRK